MPKPVESVLLGIHADDTLNVFIRNDGDLFQAAKFATHNGVTPLAMTTVMADLADVFGWRQIALTSSEVPQPEPHARVLPTPTREVRSAAAGRTSTPELPAGLDKLRGLHQSHTRAIYERLLRSLTDAGEAGMRFGELHGIVGRGRSSGQVYGYLSTLVKRGLVFRPSEGMYVAVRGVAPAEAEPVDSHLSAKHPSVVGGRGGKGKLGRRGPGLNPVHKLTIEQIIAYVGQHPEGVRTAQIADALMPGDKERGHTISNRIIAYETRVKRTGETPEMHKIVQRGERGVVAATLYPGPPPS